MSSEQLERRRRTVEAARANGEALDPAIEQSWERSRPVVRSDSTAAPVDAESDEVRERWEASPIRRSGVELESQLEAAAADSGMIAAVTDDEGRILWAAGNHQMMHDAEQVGFVPGGRWDERSAGTNALGLALVTGKLSSVFSAEHWVDAVRDWACWSVPITAPNGRRLGVIDLSCHWDDASPMAPLALTAIGRLVEANLPGDAGVASGAGAGVTAGGAIGIHAAADIGDLELRILGNTEVRLAGVPITMTPRQAELLAALAIEGPCSLDQLQQLVWGDRPVSATTVKAEISHLRRLLGGAIASRPYRLTVPVRVDALEVDDSVRSGDLEAAVASYHGQLLPRSEAPFANDRRHVIDVALRRSLLRAGTGAQLLRFGSIHRYDEEVLEQAAERTAADDPLRDQAIAWLDLARRA